MAVRRTRPHELISDDEQGTLFQAMAGNTPEELLIAGAPGRGAELVLMVTGVVMTGRGVGK
ncbi:hypothetical protein ACFPH6_28735 [Streptomyces xiangluensis]|uniref:Uncharacterized protein n=1 Tax=Streptomyces xiangluensis TaxID=2665720 RepID=A0ABV8YV96_9ACTN